MARRELFGWAHVKDRDLPGLDASKEFIATHGFKPDTLPQERLRGHLHLGQPRLRKQSELSEKIGHPFVGHPICHKKPGALSLNQSRPAQNLEMPGSVGDRAVGLSREHFDRPRSLA
jgi:hypothetical protein